LLSNSFQILEFGFPSTTCASMALIYHFSRSFCSRARLLY